MPERWRGTRDSLRRLGFLNVEMETGTLLTVARIYGLRAAAVCAVFGAGPQRRPVPMGEEAAIGVASDALASVR